MVTSRPGSCASNNGLDGFNRKIEAEAAGPSEDLTFRLDKGLTSGDTLDTIEELGVGYVGKIKLTANIMGQISRIKKWRLYNRGALVEQVIDESKNDSAATEIRTENFWANDALFQTGLIAYNLLNCTRWLAFPKWFRTARIKRIGFLFVQHACQRRPPQQTAMGKNQARSPLTTHLLQGDGRLVLNR